MAKNIQPLGKAINVASLDETLNALLNAKNANLLDGRKKRLAKRLARAEAAESEQALVDAPEGAEEGFDLALADGESIELAQASNDSDVRGAGLGGGESGAPVFGMPSLISDDSAFGGVLLGGLGGGLGTAGAGLAAAGVAVASSASSSDSGASSTARAINTISAAAEGNTATASTPDVSTYQNAGVTGVDGSNLAAINSVLNSAAVNGVATDTTEEIQALVDAYKVLLNAADGTADGDPKATQADYAKIGVTGVDTAVEVSLLGEVIDAKKFPDVDSVAEVQTLANAVAAVMSGAAGGTAPTLEQLKALGIEGVTAGNLAAVQAAIAATPNDGGGVDSAHELQTVVNSAIVPAGIAINTISAAAEGNTAGATTPDAAVYRTAGVTGVDGSNLAAINNALNTAAVNGAATDTASEIQAVVDAYNKIFGEANGSAADATPGNNPSAVQYAAIGASIGLAATDTENRALLNDIIGAKNTTDVDTVAEINRLAQIANGLQAIAVGGAANPALTPADFAAIGLTGVTAVNLPAVLAKIAGQPDDGSGTDSLTELQTLVGTVNAAIDVIKQYAETNAGTVPTLQNYLDAGVTGVTDEATKDSINSAMATAGVTGAKADTTAHIQTVVDAYNRILGEANGTTPDATPGVNPSAAQYTAIGAAIGLAATDAENLALLNDIVGAQARIGVDTVGEIDNLARIANAIQAIAAGGSANPALTPADFASIGIAGVTAGNLPAVLAKIAGQPDDGSGTDSLTELQTLVGTANAAIDVIKQYAETNTGTVPTLQNYLDAGVTGVTDEATKDSINSAMATAFVTGDKADTSADIQAVVDAYNKILGEANGSTPDATPGVNPSAAQYAAIGASIDLAATDAENLALLNDIVGAQARIGVDTVGEIDNLARIANAIQVIAAGGSANPALTPDDFAAIGLTGVTDGNLPALLGKIAEQLDDGSGTDSLSELRALLNPFTPGSALDIIKNYAETNGGTVPTLQNYLDAGVTGVTDEAIKDSINSAMATAGVTGANADTAAHIQTVVDAYKAILEEANGAAPDQILADPSAAQYAAIGANIGAAATDAENLSLLNDALGGKVVANVDTVAEINELAVAANAVQSLAAGSAGLTMDQLSLLGVTGNGGAALNTLSTTDQQNILTAINNTNNNGSETDTVAKLQALVNQQLSPGLEASQSLDGVSDLGVDSALVIAFNQDISVKSGHIRIFDDMGTAGWAHTNAQSGQSVTDTYDNDVDITLLNGVITAVKIGGVDYTSRFDLAHSVQAVGHNLVIDLKPAVPASAGTSGETVSPFSTAFDWDFGANYHVELDANVVMNSALVGNKEVSDATTLNFRTVTPTDTTGGPASHVMDASGVSTALSEGYIWLNGNQSQSSGQTVSLDLINDSYAVVIDSSGGSSGLGSLGGRVSLQHFGFDDNTALTRDDILYNDNHGNMALATTDGVDFAANNWLDGGGSTGFADGTFTRLIGDNNAAGSTGSAYVNFNNTSTNSPTGAYTNPIFDTYFEDQFGYNANVIIFG